jgi:hypothetical protein
VIVADDIQRHYDSGVESDIPLDNPTNMYVSDESEFPAEMRGAFAPAVDAVEMRGALTPVVDLVEMRGAEPDVVDIVREEEPRYRYPLLEGSSRGNSVEVPLDLHGRPPMLDGKGLGRVRRPPVRYSPDALMVETSAIEEVYNVVESNYRVPESPVRKPYRPCMEANRVILSRAEVDGERHGPAYTDSMRECLVYYGADTEEPLPEERTWSHAKGATKQIVEKPVCRGAILDGGKSACRGTMLGREPPSDGSERLKARYVARGDAEQPKARYVADGRADRGGEHMSSSVSSSPVRLQSMRVTVDKEIVKGIDMRHSYLGGSIMRTEGESAGMSVRVCPWSYELASDRKNLRHTLNNVNMYECKYYLTESIYERHTKCKYQPHYLTYMRELAELEYRDTYVKLTVEVDANGEVRSEVNEHLRNVLDQPCERDAIDERVTSSAVSPFEVSDRWWHGLAYGDESEGMTTWYDSDTCVVQETLRSAPSALGRGLSTEYGPTIVIGSWIVFTQEQSDVGIARDQSPVKDKEGSDSINAACENESTMRQRVADETEGAPFCYDPRSTKAHEIVLQLVRIVQPSIEREEMLRGAVEYVDDEQNDGSASEAEPNSVCGRPREVGVVMTVSKAGYTDLIEERRPGVEALDEGMVDGLAEPMCMEEQAYLLRRLVNVEKVPEVYLGDDGKERSQRGCGTKGCVEDLRTWNRA